MTNVESAAGEWPSNSDSLQGTSSQDSQKLETFFASYEEAKYPGVFSLTKELNVICATDHLSNIILSM